MLVLVLMAGVTGTGKSTLANGLGRAQGWPVIDKDTAKSTLLARGLPEDVAAPLAYDLMFAQASDLLGQGYSVVLDSPASSPLSVRNARRIAQEVPARLKVVLCTADRTLREARLRARTPKLSQPDRPDEPPTDEASRYAHLPSDTLTVDTSRPLAALLAEVSAYVLS